MPTLLGLNSGTSADGVDAVVVSFEGTEPALPLSILAVTHRGHPDNTRSLIEEVIQRGESSLETICHLNRAVAESFADAAEAALAEAKISGDVLDVAAMHGQTIWHLPPADAEPKGLLPSTLQIGDGSILADRLGCPVASDLRTADVAAGGQGAPLTAILDHALFTSPHESRVRLNLGGIANITWLPAGARGQDVVAFDTGPSNTLIDQTIRRLTNSAETLDHDGQRAMRGHVDEELLSTWLTLPYFSLAPPKTTGRELFGPAMVEKLIEDGKHLSEDDLIATITALTPASIADAIARHLPNKPHPDAMIIHGGGVHNPAIMRGLHERLPGVRLATVEEECGIPVQALEPLLFAVLGWRCLNRTPSFLPHATGAQRPAVLGKISWPA